MTRSAAIVAILAAALAAGTGLASAAPVGATDVCKALPGALVAAEMKTELLATRNFPDPGRSRPRCVYQLAVPGSKTEEETAIVVWFMPPATYDELAAAQDGPVEKVTDVGDAAYAFYEASDKRYKLVAVKRDRGTVEVSAENEEPLRALARLALDHLPAR